MGKSGVLPFMGSQRVRQDLATEQQQPWQRICLLMQAPQEMQVPSLGRENPPKEEMANHSSVLAWQIPWTEEPGGL